MKRRDAILERKVIAIILFQAFPHDLIFLLVLLYIYVLRVCVYTHRYEYMLHVCISHIHI